MPRRKQGGYAQRTDLAGPNVASGVRQPPVYGEGVAREEQLRAAPFPTAAPPRPVVPLSAPTQRPDEPVSAGLPVGPGPGPEALMLSDSDDLRALYQETGSEAIRELIEAMEEGW